MAQKFGFGGKELSEELGLNWHDFSARNYDASLGRWMNIDPLADSFYEWSPYNYSYNSPIMFNDPTGMGPESTIVDKNGTIIEHIDDKDTNIYLDPGNKEDPKIIVGTEREGETYTEGESIVVADLSDEGVEIILGNDSGDGDVTIAKTENEVQAEKVAEVKNFLKSWFGLGDGTGTEAPQMLGPKGPKGKKVSKNNSARRGKGERKQTKKASGTDNPFKHLRADPNKPGNVLQKNTQTGKTVSKKAPPGYIFPQ